MYESHWQLSQKPFEPHSDESFFFETPTHHTALCKLRYAIESHRGLASLTGPEGTGKSCLARHLTLDLAETFRPVINIGWPNLPLSDLISLLVQEWGNQMGEWTVGSNAVLSLGEAVSQLAELVRKNADAHRHGLILLDETESVEEVPTILDVLRLENGSPAATLLLVGRPHLLTQLGRSSGIANHLDVSALLRPLNESETAGYVRHRLTVAGAPECMFDEGALQAIFEHTSGIPRRINRLADLALFAGFSEEAPTIGRPLVESVAQELVLTFA